MAPSNLWNERGELQRPATQFRDFISNDANARFPPEKGRYHLYVSYACPWAHRTLIVRKLKGLEDLITVTVVHYHMSLTDSWRFYTDEDETDDEDCCPDPLHTDTQRLKELYLKAQPDYDGRFSVPVLWDRKLETIVSNESSEIIRMMYSAFDQLLPPEFQQVDLYPQVLRQEIDQTNEWTYDYINNGVYKCGLAKTQEAYEEAVKSLFHHLDQVESHLEATKRAGPFYHGASITETDVRLFVTAVRFDPVYFTLFKTNKKLIRYEYPAIHAWMANLYWNVPAFRETTNFKHIKRHYFQSLTMINPFGIVPYGPDPNILPIQETPTKYGAEKQNYENWAGKA